MLMVMAAVSFYLWP